MPLTIRFHIDENVHNAVATALRAYGINITTTTEAELIGASDSEQMVFARKENRVLFIKTNIIKRCTLRFWITVEDLDFPLFQMRFDFS